MVGGVSSPVRAFKAVGGEPLFIERSFGSHIWDADGNKFVDYVLSWGPMILGHANRKVTTSLIGAARLGTSYGAPTLPELELAEEIVRSVPSIEKLRFVNSGTEATMSAVRLARAFTGRKKILKFEGCYHGHADEFLSRAGSGMATLGIPTSPGVPDEVGAGTLTVPFNDLGAVEEALETTGQDIAAMIVEPVAGNMGVIAPEHGFLEGLRRLATSNGSLLIFDEVITGFRVARGGAQGLYGVRPDLTCLGKVIGGGLPVGAYGGAREIMEMVAPEGKVYQAGTLSGNPLAMTAGLATVRQLNSTAYARLERKSLQLEEDLVEAAAGAKAPITVNRVGSMLGLFFGGGTVSNFREGQASSHRNYPAFHRSMLRGGVYLAPSPFETIFLSTVHGEGDLNRTSRAAAKAFREVAAA